MPQTATPLARDLVSPDIFPHSLSALPNSIHLIATNRATLDNASFLDERMLTPQTRGQWFAWNAVEESLAPDAREDARFIWHIGHVGSTLVARLLGALPGVLALREPLLLRALAHLEIDLGSAHAFWDEATFDRVGAGAVKLLSRTYASDEIALVKATSIAAGLAPRLLSDRPKTRSVAMYAPAQTYMATVFAGDASRAETRQLAQLRVRQLNRNLGAEAVRLSALGEGELVAMSWLTGMTGLELAAQASGDRLAWLDFNRFLGEPGERLRELADHLAIPADEGAIGQLVAGPIMTRYSKASEHPYDGARRQLVIDEARRRHAGEIERGLAWLGRQGGAHPLAAAALGR